MYCKYGHLTWGGIYLLVIDYVVRSKAIFTFTYHPVLPLVAGI